MQKNILLVRIPRSILAIVKPHREDLLWALRTKFSWEGSSACLIFHVITKERQRQLASNWAQRELFVKFHKISKGQQRVSGPIDWKSLWQTWQQWQTSGRALFVRLHFRLSVIWTAEHERVEDETLAVSQRRQISKTEVNMGVSQRWGGVRTCDGPPSELRRSTRIGLGFSSRSDGIMRVRIL